MRTSRLAHNAGKVIVMLGMDPHSKEKGGISSVVDIYRQGGLFRRWPIHYIGTVAAGSVVDKLRVFTQALVAYLRLLLRRQVALVHAQTASRASFWRKSVFMLLARASGTPVILHLHGAEFEQFYRDESGPLRRWFIANMLRGVDDVVVLSAQWRTLIENIAPGARVTTIANPIPVPPVASELVARDPRALLFLGRFGQRKGIFDLLRAVAIVRHTFADVTLRCGGDGDVDGVLECVRKLGLADCVQMLGWVTGAAKDRELARAAIYVLPSHAEGLPMGVLEAMAAGTPVISTRVGGIPDAIEDRVDGLLTEPGDIEALAERIVCLLADTQLRDRMARAAYRKAVDVFSTEKVLAQVEDLYRKLGAEPRRAEAQDPRTDGIVAKQST